MAKCIIWFFFHDSAEIDILFWKLISDRLRFIIIIHNLPLWPLEPLLYLEVDQLWILCEQIVCGCSEAHQRSRRCECEGLGSGI